VKPKGKKKLVIEIYIFILKNKKRAKQGIIFFDNDDYHCYKRIRALADLFPYNHNSLRCKLINKMIEDLWVLYYFYKINLGNRKISYENIKKRYI
tara:strand:+ start:312 stop:596 length:285 start_codon:yes stop_codon:yes gene_type:complete